MSGGGDAPKSILAVIPASSQSGLAAVKSLVNSPDADKRVLRAIVRSPEKMDYVKKAAGIADDNKNVEFVHGVDAHEMDSLVKSLTGVDAAFIVTPTSDDRGHLTREMIKAAKTAGVTRIVLGLSWTVVCNENLTEEDFGKSEKLGESLFPNRVCHLRAGYFMSNLLGSAGSIKNMGTIFHALGNKTKMAIVDPDDIGACAAQVLIKDVEPYKGVSRIVNVSGPQGFTCDEIAATVGKFIGKEVKHVQVPLEAAQQGMRSDGMHEFEIAFISCLIPHIESGHIAEPFPDVKEITGKHSTLEEWLGRNKHLFL